MDPINRSISNYIKSGEYFIDARNWYLRSFIYPIVERAIVGFLTIIFSVILFQTFLTIYSLYPIIEKVPVVIKVNNIDEDLPLIHRISQKDKSIQQSLKEYLIKRYVENWESYEFNNVQNQINVIKNASSKYIFKKFYNYISLNNPESPLLYQKQISRNIKIISMNFDDNEGNVVVKFVANSIDNTTKEVTKTTWLAFIYFQMKDIASLMQSKEDKPLDFIVTDYQVKQVK